MTDLSNIGTSVVAAAPEPVAAAAAVATVTSASTPPHTTSAQHASCCNDGECGDCTTVNNESNQNGIVAQTTTLAEDASPRRHSSMDQLMGLLNDLGKSSRTRSLSDGGKDEGNVIHKAHSRI